MAAVERNSDGSYDAVDSGGFGKDYHGQDVFGERIGGTGIGGSHFGGFEEGHFGFDDDKYKGMTKEQYSAFLDKQAEYNSVDKGSVNESSFDGSGESSEEEAGSDMRDSLRDLNSETAENSNTGDSMDTGFQIGGTDDEELAKAEERKNDAKSLLDKVTELGKSFGEGVVNVGDKYLEAHAGVAAAIDKVLNTVGIDSNLADKLKSVREGLKQSHNSDELKQNIAEATTVATDYYNEEKANVDKLKSSFTDKMKEDKPKTEDKPKETNMSKATPVKSDYETKANKDSTKEVPKETPSRNDFGNHAVDTLKGVVDKISENSTAKALGLKSVEEFAKENGIDPNKLSTMKAYQAYQTKEIVKAIPNITKKVGSYIMERIKDLFDPAQLPERIRNTLARYNAASLVGAAILSINSGSGIQTALDMALTMVDTEDQPAVSDFLEDVLKDRDTVKDLSEAVDGALAPEENSETSKLDEEIVNIGRKNNTDYDDFNAGLGTSGTTSDADVKVFIARNIKADPILRRMVEKLRK